MQLTESCLSGTLHELQTTQQKSVLYPCPSPHTYKLWKGPCESSELPELLSFLDLVSFLSLMSFLSFVSFLSYISCFVLEFQAPPSGRKCLNSLKMFQMRGSSYTLLTRSLQVFFFFFFSSCCLLACENSKFLSNLLGH